MYSKQRLTLFGHLETSPKGEKFGKQLQDCYLSYHPDASHFIPGRHDSPHLAIWTRFIVDKVYRVGGYGDESQIGWLEMDRWQRAGRGGDKEWQAEWKHAFTTFDEGDTGTSTQNMHPAVDSDRLAALFADNGGNLNGPSYTEEALVFQR
jgi:hypothetical protein